MNNDDKKRAVMIEEQVHRDLKILAAESKLYMDEMVAKLVGDEKIRRMQEKAGEEG